jgi:outer membrane immunogenic protein
MSLRTKIVATVAGVLAVTDLAWGADLPPPPVPTPQYYNWTGLYIGVNAGYASAKVTETPSDGSGPGSATIPGALGGAQMGYNYQIGGVVVGFEADFDGSMATKSITAGTASGTNQIPWIGTLRGRVGYAFDRWLVYATAGGAATQVRSTVNVAGIGSANTSNTSGAWTAGGGIEAAITDNLSARLEYLYLDTGTMPVAQVGGTPPPPFVTVTGRLQDNLVRMGLNYRLPVAW